MDAETAALMPSRPAGIYGGDHNGDVEDGHIGHGDVRGPKENVGDARVLPLDELDDAEDEEHRQHFEDGKSNRIETDQYPVRQRIAFTAVEIELANGGVKVGEGQDEVDYRQQGERLAGEPPRPEVALLFRLPFRRHKFQVPG